MVRVSGTIKKAEEEAIKRARAAILRAKRENREGSIEGLMAILDGGDENDFLGSAVKGGEQTRAGLDVSEEEIELGIASDGDD